MLQLQPERGRAVYSVLEGKVALRGKRARKPDDNPMPSKVRPYLTAWLGPHSIPCSFVLHPFLHTSTRSPIHACLHPSAHLCILSICASIHLIHLSTCASMVVVVVKT